MANFIFADRNFISYNVGSYPDWDTERLIEACGILPQWLFEFEFLVKRGVKKFSELVEYMTECYGFGSLHKFEGHVDPDTQEYISKYEDDEPLAPYLKIHFDTGQEALIYPYAIIALPTPDGYFITRMD